MTDTPSLNFEEIGGIEIFRPRYPTEVEVRTEAERHLRCEFSVGRHTDGETINRILQYQFAFYTHFLDQLLPILASLDFLKFLLAEYDKTSEIDGLYKNNQLNSTDKKRWAFLGPILRRAIKYLAERVILFGQEELPAATNTKRIKATEKVWICAEELVMYYIQSDQTHMVFPDDTSLEIHPEGSGNYWTLDINNNSVMELQERIRIDTMNRANFVPSPSFELQSNEHEKVLADVFKNTIGISYLEVLGTLRALIDGAQPSQDDFPIPFVHREQTLNSLASCLGFPRKTVDQAIAGFSISKSKLEAEGREIWKPKQEYRAFRRGFLEFPHSTGAHLIFSKAMAKESAIQLVEGVVFKDIPPEWRSREVDVALDTLSNKAGKWFEQVVFENLESVGIFGQKSIKNGLGQQDRRIAVPPDVGEIDYLGYSPSENLLVLCECKMVRGGSEPKYFRDDIHEFVGSKKSYFWKFQRKIEWVRQNINAICNALSSARTYDAPIVPTCIATALITLYPSIASYVAEAFPCVTITELMMEYKHNGNWPFAVGIYDC